MVNEPSVFEPLKFYSISFRIPILFSFQLDYEISRVDCSTSYKRETEHCKKMLISAFFFSITSALRFIFFRVDGLSNRKMPKFKLQLINEILVSAKVSVWSRVG